MINEMVKFENVQKPLSEFVIRSQQEKGGMPGGQDGPWSETL